jgi:hypothetical protein
MAASPPILEPLSTGDIIDRSIGIYRRNARPLLATVTVPFLIGSLGWLLVQFAQGFVAEGESVEAVALPLVLMLGGFGMSMLYGYLMVLATAGLSRAVGDHIMLGTPITVRGTMRAVRARLGDLTLGSLILAGGLMAGSTVAMVVLFAAIMLVTLVGAAVGAAGLPDVVTGIVVVLVMLVAFAGVLLVVVPMIVARIVFIPQAIMIEGCNAGAALSRSFALGAKNWNRVLGILAFSYFASWSLAAAVLAPVLIGLWLTGYLDFDFETFNAVTGGINQFSSFLVVPVWAIAYTLLYFDSRVRREGYDVDLLARRLPAPPAPVRPPAPYQMPGGPAPQPRMKFAEDGRCLRCGHHNLGLSASCARCGW